MTHALHTEPKVVEHALASDKIIGGNAAHLPADKKFSIAVCTQLGQRAAQYLATLLMGTTAQVQQPRVSMEDPGKHEPFHADLVAHAVDDLREELFRVHVDLRGSLAAAVASGPVDLERVT